VAAATPTPSPAATGPAARLWVDPDGGTCTRQPAPAAHAQADAQACRSLHAASRRARPGDTVKVLDAPGGNDYGPQAIPAGTRGVTFEGTPTRPELGQLVNGSAGTTVRNVIVEDRGAAPPLCAGSHNSILYLCAPRQTYENVIVDGLAHAGAPGACPREGIGDGGQVIDGLVFRDGEVRNLRDTKGVGVGGRNLTFENVSFRDITVHNACEPEVHNECMYLSDVPGFTLKGSSFVRCPTMAVFFTNWHDSPYGDVVIEDNLFTHTLDESQSFHPSCALNVGEGVGRLDGWRIRRNTFENAPCVEDLPGDGTSVWSANLGGIACVDAFAYRDNVGETCGGPGDRPVSPAVNVPEAPNQAPFYVDAPGGDYRVRPGVPAAGARLPGQR
jgi:hypothetical protein